MKQRSDAILHAEQAHYLESIEPARDPLLEKMERFAAERRLPISDPEVASFLAVTARACSPKLIVEVGANIGYGAIVLARAAGDAARVITLELNEAHCATARGFIAEAGLAHRIEVRQGRALELLEAMTESIDLAYIDCVKTEYGGYLERIVPRLSERGVVVADNVLWKGTVAQSDPPAEHRTEALALRDFNRVLLAHPKLRAVVLPLGDGVAYASKIT